MESALLAIADALGAKRSNLTGLFVREVLVVLASGWFRWFLGVPVALSIGFLFASALLAMAVPLRRAAKVDPATALRYE